MENNVREIHLSPVMSAERITELVENAKRGQVIVYSPGRYVIERRDWKVPDGVTLRQHRPDYG